VTDNRHAIAAVPVGGTYYDRDAGVTWRVLATDGEHRLIMTEHVHNHGVQFNTVNQFVRWHVLTTAHPIRVAMNEFWGSNISAELRGIAVPADGLDNDVRTAPGNFNAAENQPIGRTTPGTGTANATNALFILSLSEANQYFANDTARRGTEIDGTGRRWWLRSPGANMTDTVAHVGSGGDLITQSANADNTNRSMRPVMWVRP